METNFHLTIVGPEDIIFYGEAQSITLPGSIGGFTILPGHVPFISSLKQGIILYIAQGKSVSLKIVGGFVEVKQNKVSVCVR